MSSLLQGQVNCCTDASPQSYIQQDISTTEIKLDPKISRSCFQLHCLSYITPDISCLVSTHTLPEDTCRISEKARHENCKTPQTREDICLTLLQKYKKYQVLNLFLLLLQTSFNFQKWHLHFCISLAVSSNLQERKKVQNKIKERTEKAVWAEVFPYQVTVRTHVTLT